MVQNIYQMLSYTLHKQKGTLQTSHQRLHQEPHQKCIKNSFILVCVTLILLYQMLLSLFFFFFGLFWMWNLQLSAYSSYSSLVQNGKKRKHNEDCSFLSPSTIAAPPCSILSSDKTFSNIEWEALDNLCTTCEHRFFMDLNFGQIWADIHEACKEKFFPQGLPQSRMSSGASQRSLLLFTRKD